MSRWKAQPHYFMLHFMNTWRWGRAGELGEWRGKCKTEWERTWSRALIGGEGAEQNRAGGGDWWRDAGVGVFAVAGEGAGREGSRCQDTRIPAAQDTQALESSKESGSSIHAGRFTARMAGITIKEHFTITLQ
ncbi:hypothetical protein E2C01_024162 [Portunus trituberculatus]|uniref:Uncharacterized protein n=1 Tax=Portunus trituberculatus TaxID=210409 RepID=A0A5B7EBZ0_PORTR|nr:hypothetical protein [Portunus trituberculatus]